LRFLGLRRRLLVLMPTVGHRNKANL
jgi:hypothetical protein